MNSKKVKGRGKRFIAGFLALLMAVTLLPVNTLSVAYAEELDAVETEAPDSVAVVDEESDTPQVVDAESSEDVEPEEDLTLVADEANSALDEGVAENSKETVIVENEAEEPLYYTDTALTAITTEKKSLIVTDGSGNYVGDKDDIDGHYYFDCYAKKDLGSTDTYEYDGVSIPLKRGAKLDASGYVKFEIGADSATLKLLYAGKNNNSTNYLNIGSSITTETDAETTDKSITVSSNTWNLYTYEKELTKGSYSITRTGNEFAICYIAVDPTGGSDTKTATFTTEPTLTSSNASAEVLHPGDTLTLAYEVALITDGLEAGQTDADASTIAWVSVDEDGTEATLEANAGSDNKVYTVKDADVGKTIKATVTPQTTYSDAGTAKSATSVEVTALETGFKTEPTLTTTGNLETPFVGDTLTVNFEKAADENRNVSIAWIRVTPGENEGDPATETPLTADTGSDDKSYTLIGDDEDSTIKVKVTISSGNEDTAPVEKTLTTNTVVAWTFGFNSLPVLATSGDDKTVLYPGETLTVSYALNKAGTDKSEIKWERVTPATESEAEATEEISSAAANAEGSKTYTVTKADIDKVIRVTVTPKLTGEDNNEYEIDDADKGAESKDSIVVTAKKVTFKTNAAPTLSISNNGNLAYPKPDDVLTVEYELEKDAADADNSTIVWARIPATGDPVELTAVADSNGRSYKIVEADVGSTIKVEVTPKTNNTYASDGDAKDVTSNEVKDPSFAPSYNLELIASDIPAGTYTNTITKTGFTIKAGEDEGTGEEKVSKSVAVDANSKTVGSVAYKARLKMSGVGTKDYRSIQFTTAAEATLKIVCASSNNDYPSKLGIGTITTDADSQAETLTDFTGKYKLSNGTETDYTAGGITINNEVGAVSDKTHIVEAALAADTTYCLYTTEGSGINFYAVYVNYANGKSADYFTLTLDANGGNAVDSQRALSGECYIEPSAARLGYALNGWYTSKESADAETEADKYDFSTPVTGDLKLYAGWTEAPAQGNQYEIDMSELPVGTYNSEFKWKAFTFTPGSGKTLTVDASEAKGVEAPDGTKHDYTQRLKFGGSGDKTKINLSFSIEKEADLTIVAVSGNGSDDRTLVVSNEAGTTKYEITAPASVAMKSLGNNEKLTPGKWYIYSKSSGVNIYYINVDFGDDGGDEEDTVEFTQDPAFTISAGANLATPHVGDKLTLGFTANNKADATKTVISWYRMNGTTKTELTADADDATGKTYTIKDTDVDGVIKADVTIKNTAETDNATKTAENAGKVTLVKAAAPVAYDKVTDTVIPSGRQIPKGTEIVLKSTDADVIFYTTNGKAPTRADTELFNIANPIVVDRDMTITAVAVKKGMAESETVKFVYTVVDADTVIAPYSDPVSGTYDEEQVITLVSGTLDAVIYYTVDGNDPVYPVTDEDKSTTKYTSPFSIDKDTTIKAIAVKENMTNSSMATFEYKIAAKAPVAVGYTKDMVVDSGTTVSLSSATAGAKVYFAQGNSESDAQAALNKKATEYSDSSKPVITAGKNVIAAYAQKDGASKSATVTFVYQIKLNVPRANVTTTEVTKGTNIILTADEGASIYYKTASSQAAAASVAEALYNKAIRIDVDTYIWAVAKKGDLVSAPFEATYTVKKDATGKPVVNSDGLEVELVNPDEILEYTGKAVTPAIIVTNNSEPLIEGVDYTVRYTNNIKANTGVDGNLLNRAKLAKVTVTGKGNLTGSAYTEFKIYQKDLGDSDVFVPDVTVQKNKAATLVLAYNGVKLTAKDYTVKSVSGSKDDTKGARATWLTDGTMILEGQGNFKGTTDIDIKAVDSLKKFKVVIDTRSDESKAILTYNGEDKKEGIASLVKVYASTDKKNENPLSEFEDYMISWPANTTDAGAVKFSILGCGDYSGLMAKSVTIKPATDRNNSTSITITGGPWGADGSGDPTFAKDFVSTGVTFNDELSVSDNKGNDLTEGKDYKVAYSANKKSGSTARVTVSFLGNYKGNKAQFKTFTINKIGKDSEAFGDIKVKFGNTKPYTNAGIYKAPVYLSIDGAELKNSDFDIKYYINDDRTTEMKGRDKLTIADAAEYATVYVTIKGKGRNNFADDVEIKVSYNVYAKAGTRTVDLSRAKVEIYDGANPARKTSKLPYSGNEIELEAFKEGTTMVAGTYYVKVFDGTALVDPSQYEVEYSNNKNKGRATVIISPSKTAGATTAGCKTATFTIAANNLKALQDLLFQKNKPKS